MVFNNIMKFNVVRYVICPLVAMVLWATPSMAASEQVVVLHSTATPSRWTDGLTRGLESVLGDDVDVVSVHLGTSAEGDDYFDDQYVRLSQEWKDAAVTAVVTDGPVAFAFMRKYREDVFIGVPVVYCGMARPDPVFLKECGDCTGLPVEYEVEKTLDLIFTLRPETSVVVGVMGATPESRQLRAALEAAMEPYLDHAEVIFPGHEPGDSDGLDMELVGNVASSVPGSGALMYLGLTLDRHGLPLVESDVVERLVQKSTVPVFVLSKQWMGSGVLGGVVVDGEAHGREVGRLIRRVHAGEPVREMLAQAVVPRPVVDLTVMAQYGMGQHRLPEETVTLNAPVRPDGGEDAVSTGMTIVGVALLAGVVLFLVIRRREGRKGTRSAWRP